jgi:UDP-glucose 4-epimerase
MDIKSVLVTGGAGFIGSHLVDKYLELGMDVYVLDDFSSGNWKNIPHFSTNHLHVRPGSVLNKKIVCKLCSEVDLVEHLAAGLEVYKGIKNTLAEAKQNILGTINVLEGARKAKVKKFHYASSGGVYGQNYTQLEETDIPKPHWPYGVSKLAGEQYVMQYNRLYGLNTTCFRYSIVYGPREWYGRVLTMFINRVLHNKPPVIFGSGTQIRDFIYVSDVLTAHINDLEYGVPGEVYNISSSQPTSIKDLAYLVTQAMHTNLTPVYDDIPEGTASKYQPERIRLVGELDYFVLNNTKARQLLEWQPKVPLKNGIIKEIDWVEGHLNRWQTKPRV